MPTPTQPIKAAQNRAKNVPQPNEPQPRSNVPAASSEASTTKQANEGEGNRTAAREYDAATEKYIRSGRVDKAAEEAKRAVDGDEGEELRDAEEKGRARAAEDDE